MILRAAFSARAPVRSVRSSMRHALSNAATITAMSSAGKGRPRPEPGPMEPQPQA